MPYLPGRTNLGLCEPHVNIRNIFPFLRSLRSTEVKVISRLSAILVCPESEDSAGILPNGIRFRNVGDRRLARAGPSVSLCQHHYRYITRRCKVLDRTGNKSRLNVIPLPHAPVLPNHGELIPDDTGDAVLADSLDHLRLHLVQGRHAREVHEGHSLPEDLPCLSDGISLGL